MHPTEHEIGRIAGRQDNVITVAQLLGAGLSRRTLQGRVRRGTVQRLHRGVYLIGPAPPSFAARCRAATLAIGAGAAVSHRSAAALLGLRPEHGGPIEVTVYERSPRSRAGIVLHRASLIGPELTDVDAIPVTRAARIVGDLAPRLASAELEQLLIDARVARLVSDRELHAVLSRVPGRRGAARLRALLAEEAEEGYSRSRAERLLRSLIRSSGLPLPVFNEPLHGFTVDAHWRAQRVVVEVDGRRFHGHAAAFERDRRRDQILAAAGYRVIRVTWRQLTREPIAVAVRLAQALVWAEAA